MRLIDRVGGMTGAQRWITVSLGLPLLLGFLCWLFAGSSGPVVLDDPSVPYLCYQVVDSDIAHYDNLLASPSGLPTPTVLALKTSVASLKNQRAQWPGYVKTLGLSKMVDLCETMSRMPPIEDGR